jgi:hypothetical protein
MKDSVEKKSLLQTSKLNSEKVEIEPKKSGGFLSAHMLKDRKLPQLSDREFVQKYFSEIPEKKVKELRTEVEKVLAARPREVFWKCTNPKCSHRVQRAKWDYQGGPCIFCNWAGYKDSGQMERMSKREVEAYLRWEKNQYERWLERMKKSDFEMQNQRRKNEGLDPYNWEEFLELRKKEWQQRLSRGI